MNISKIIITKGIFHNKELRLLVSFDKKDNQVDLINLDVTKVGEIHIATVEKVLIDIDACIVKLDNGDKGFIENKRLVADKFILRHSEKKLVCQGDKFYVRIAKDKKGIKPYSCDFISEPPSATENYSFIDYYVENYADNDYEIVSDLPETINSRLNVREYHDDEISLWSLYGFAALLDKVTSKIVHLKSGANIVIEPTEALTIIDVNTSKSYGKLNAYATNIEALDEIAKQIRLRSISGIIIVDMLKVSPSEEKSLQEHAKSVFAGDISLVKIHGFTKLGLLEITRSRMFAPLSV